MKHIYLVISLLFLATISFAEEPVKAVGIRGGLSSGIEYRVFSGNLTSYKVLLSTRKQGIQLTGLKEFHVPDAFDIDQEEFTFVYGFGAHAGFESWYRDSYYNDIYHTAYRERRSGPVAGLDALAGIEYNIREIPLVFGIEVKPYFNLFGKNFFQLQPFDFAFTVKYTF
ncbi:MAG TPA: hypothetical protein PKO30_11275 [Prolixibacteraceae bacterium]|jgi:hypothetical protein|nr:hypothetical protein [Prolixibacteraceae bacterium]